MQTAEYCTTVESSITTSNEIYFGDEVNIDLDKLSVNSLSEMDRYLLCFIV
jgi:hypothetical protein